MRKIALHLLLLFICINGLLPSLNGQEYIGFKNQTDSLLVTKILRIVPLYTGGHPLNLQTLECKRGAYSVVITGAADLQGVSNIAIRAIFNSVDTLTNFQMNFPEDKSIKPSALSSLSVKIPDWTQFYLPSAIRDKLILDSCDMKFNNSGLGMDTYYYGLKVLENWEIFSDVDMAFSKIALGFTLQVPDSEEEDKDAKKEAPPKAKTVSVTGLMTAYFKFAGITEVSITSNLVKDINDWTITGELRSLSLNHVLSAFKIDDLASTFVPPVILNQSIEKLTLDVKPAKGVELTALTTFGNMNLMVERETVDKKPLSTLMNGGYNPKPRLTDVSPNAQFASSGANKPARPRSDANAPLPAAETKGYKWGLMAGFSLPQNFSFASFIPELAILDNFQLYNGAFYFSTFEAAPQNSLPAFQMLGAGNPTVYKGITFIIGVNADSIKINKAIGSITDLTGVSFVTFSANVPANPAELSLNAGINTAENLNIANRIYFPYLELGLEPDGSGGRKFSLSGLMDLKIDDNTTLNFIAKGKLDPGKSTISMAGSMKNNWNNAFGIKGFSFGGLELGAGINFSYTPFPLPDDISLAGSLGFGKITGKARIGLDINEPSRSHFIGQLNDVSWDNLIDYLFEEQVKIKIPGYLKPYFNSKINNAAIKFVPPGVGTIRTLTDEVLTPGFRIAGDAEIAGWGGFFDLTLEGYEGGMNAGIKAHCLADPINLTVGNLIVFKLTGANNTSKPEMKVDLTAGNLLKAITSLPAENKETEIVKTDAAYYLLAKHSNKAIDIAGASMDLQGKVHQWTLNRSGAQQFLFEANGNGYYSIKNSNSQMYLDVQNGLPVEGQPVWQYIGNKTDAQLFKPVLLKNGAIELESKLNPQMVVTVGAGTSQDGEPIVIAKRKSSPDQQFSLEPVMRNTRNDSQISSENSFVFVNGGLTILGVNNANAFINLTNDGYVCQLDGKVYDFLDAKMNAQIKSFKNPLKETFVKVHVKQEVYESITEELRKLVSATKGVQFVKPFIDKGFTIREIYFEGELEALKSGATASVDFILAGKKEQVKVSIKAGTMVDFIKSVAAKVFEISLPVLADIKKTFDDAEKLAKETAEKAAAATKELAEQTARETAEKARLAKEAADKAAKETKELAEKAAREAEEKTKLAADASLNAALEFSSFSEAAVQKIWKRPMKEIGNFADDFSGTIDKLSGKTERKLIRINGPTYRIKTKFSNLILQSESSKETEHHVYLSPVMNRLQEEWQLIPSGEEGYCYVVSANSGLNLNVDDHRKTDGAMIRMMKHKVEDKSNEKVKLEMVPGEVGWYYLQFKHSGSYATLNSTNYPATSQVLNRIPVWIFARHSNLCLETNDGRLQQNEQNTSPQHQSWKLIPVANTGWYLIQHANTGDYITVDVKNNQPSAGQTVVRKSLVNSNAQKFKLVPTGNEGYFKIESALGNNLVLDILNGSLKKEKMQVWTDNGNYAQQFYFVPVDRPKLHQTKSKSEASKFRFEPAGNKTW